MHNLFNRQLLVVVILILHIMASSCKKDWLDAKPNKSLVVPKTIEDYQAILDNYVIMNGSLPSLGEVCSDDYYLLYNIWQSRNSFLRNAYTWAKDIYEGAVVFDWSEPYRQVFYSNVALEGLNEIEPNSAQIESWNNAKGGALFFRAYAHYHLATVFATPYNESSSSSDLGIPIRLNSDVKARSNRASIKQTYEQVIDDLNNAVNLLPATVQFKNRPSKPAVFALLARIYLSMGKYGEAEKYADSCLKLHNTLLDYNSVANTNNPFTRGNQEVIFHSTLFFYNVFLPANLIVDSTLYQSYNTSDLRRSRFFRLVSNNQTFKGSYDGSNTLFGGLATDEIILIRAECMARRGEKDGAMNDLNNLLVKRWSNTITYSPLTASSSTDALNQVLKERRKELLFRGLRWTDLRRLNKEPTFEVTLKRNLNGQLMMLQPNDPKYILPIPDNEITMSGIQQNPR